MAPHAGVEVLPCCTQVQFHAMKTVRLWDLLDSTVVRQRFFFFYLNDGIGEVGAIIVAPATPSRLEDKICSNKINKGTKCNTVEHIGKYAQPNITWQFIYV